MTKPKTKQKKNDAGDKDAASVDNKCAESPLSNGSSSSAQPTRSPSLSSEWTSNSIPPSLTKSPSISSEWLVADIQTMMFGFGDCRKPLLEAAKLVESVLRQQMSSLLFQASEVANSRGSRLIGLEDILFIMRRDKVKLSRLLKYICHKDVKMICNATVKITTDEDTASQHTEIIAESTEAPLHSAKGKLRKICHKFLSSIDQTGELVALLDDAPLDEVKHERYLRAFHYGSSMDDNLYMEYSEAKSASFSNKIRINKFRDWLLQDLGPTDLKPNSLGLEIFSYLSYETIAQIVDLSLLVKQDTNPLMEDSLFRGMPPTYFNQDYPSVQAPAMKANCPSSHPGSPTQAINISPPSSPSVQTSAEGITVHGNAKTKGEKRKRSGSTTNFEIPISQAIQPADILEAIRRYYQSQTGPMTPFSKVHILPPGRKLLCC